MEGPGQPARRGKREEKESPARAKAGTKERVARGPRRPLQGGWPGVC